MAVRKIGNRYYCYCVVRDEDGKRHYKTLEGESFSKKKDAELRDAKWKLERAAGMKPVITKKTFGEIADKWLEVRSSKISPRTRQAYVSHVSHLKNYFGKEKITKIDRKSIECFLAVFAKTHEAKTVNDVLGKMKAILEAAIDWGYINVSPAAKVSRYRVRRAEIKALDPSDVFKVAAAASDRARPIILTAYYTGMRIGEIFALRWNDVDFERNQITIRKSKTDAGIRIIPMMPDLRALLKEQNKESNLVFPNEEGNELNQSNFRIRHWLPAVEAAGMGHIGFHTLRHSFVSYLINRGEPVTVIQRLVGHRSPDTTLRVYSHMFEGAERAAIERMGEELTRLREEAAKELV